MPVEHRDKYMMQYKSRMGGEELRRVTNSDMIQFDHYLYQLRDFVYSQAIQDTLFREKR